MLELVHLFLDAPVWSEAAMERAKGIWINHHRSLAKSLERSTADRVMDAMLGPERCFTNLAYSLCCLSVQQMHANEVDWGCVRSSVTGQLSAIQARAYQGMERG